MGKQIQGRVMKKLISITVVTAVVFVSTSVMAKAGWRKVAISDVGGSIWAVSFEVPKGLKEKSVRRGKTTMNDTIQQMVFSSKKKCLQIPLPPGCDSSSIAFSAMPHLSGILDAKKEHDEVVDLGGAKDNRALMTKRSIRFVTPDDKAIVLIEGSEKYLKDIIATVTLSK